MSVIVTTDENTIVFIPQFTFIDDAVTIPFKSVASSDSVVLSESIAPFVFEPRTDSLTFTEAITLNADLNLYDSVTATDRFESIVFEQFDTSSFIDSIGPLSISGPHEHLYVGESVNAALEATDSGSVQETPEIGIFIDDSITASEFINEIAFAQTDTAQATDLLVTLSTFVETFDVDSTFAEYDLFITADPPGTDHLHWNDEFDYQFIATTLSTLDDPVISELTPSIEIPVVDSANVSEFIQLSLVGSDEIFNTDQLVSLIVNTPSDDQFIYQELFELITDTNSLDSLSITDASFLTVNAVGTQLISFTESVSITVSVADSGNLKEIVANNVAQSDSLHFVENRSIGLTQSDIAILNDLALINTNVAKKDLAIFVENDKFITLASNQIIHLSEKPFYNADYARLDYLFLISEIASAAILKEDSDQFEVTDFTSSIALQGLQLITFKERTGIGKAAPIILNINDNPTVHGTVTGDIISISTGGTEPVLL